MSGSFSQPYGFRIYTRKYRYVTEYWTLIEIPNIRVFFSKTNGVCYKYINNCQGKYTRKRVHYHYLRTMQFYGRSTTDNVFVRLSKIITLRYYLNNSALRKTQNENNVCA